VDCAAQQISARMVRLGSKPEWPLTTLMSTSASSGHVPGLALVRVVPCMDGARGAREKNSCQGICRGGVSTRLAGVNTLLIFQWVICLVV
jgi:hypothetical protein